MSQLRTAAFVLLAICIPSTLAYAWPAPTLINPVNGALVPTGVTLDWGAVFLSERYQLQVDTSINFNSPVLYSITKNYISSSSSNPDTEQFIDDLFFGKVYHWRVRAYVAGDTSIWSQQTFITRNFVNPNAPSNGSSAWTGVTLDWLTHTGVDFYDVETDTVNTFNSPALKSASNAYINANSANSDTEYFFDDLYFGRIYFWRVRARNAVDTCAWSNVWTIATNDFVTLITPTDGQTNVNSSGITLNWNAHHGIDNYQLQLDSVPNFNSPGLVDILKLYINTNNNNFDTQHNTGVLTANTTYYWRVRALNAVDTSSWTTWSFSTANCANPGAISGNTAVCQGSTTDYSVTPVAGAVSYNWSLPAGWTGSSTTNIITATAGTGGGVISLTVTNPCGTSVAQTLNVSVDSLLAGTIGPLTGQSVVCEGALASYFVQPVPGATGYIWTSPAGWTGSTSTNNLLITAGPAGGTISVTAVNSCDTSSTVSVSTTVEPLPAQPAAITGDTIVCFGEPAGFSIQPVPGAFSYTWTLPGGWTGSSNGVSIQATAGQNGGTITVSAQNMCGLSVPQTLSVSVNVIDVSVQVNGIMLTSNANGATYQWLDCDNGNLPVPGDTSQVFVPAANGNYAVAVSQNGCTDTSACISVTSVGIKNDFEFSNPRIYPNPSDGKFTIELAYVPVETHLTISDMQGRVVREEINLREGKNIFELTVAPGIYFAKITSGKMNTVIKLIIE